MEKGMVKMIKNTYIQYMPMTLRDTTSSSFLPNRARKQRVKRAGGGERGRGEEDLI